MKRIAIIGAGHLGSALNQGLLRSKSITASNIDVSNSSEHNAEVAKNADIIFLCVKKSKLSAVLRDIKNHLRPKAVIVSAIAGVRVHTLKTMLKTNHQIVRMMPSITISICKGTIGIYASTYEVSKLMSQLGMIVEVDDEHKLDALTIASGCGPGVASYLIQSLVNSFVEVGLSETESLDVVLQTIHGTSLLLRKQKISPQKLLTQVATKGGVTESIVRYFVAHNLESITNRGLKKGRQTLLKK